MRLPTPMRALIGGLMVAGALSNPLSAQPYPAGVFVDPATQLLLERHSTEIFAVAPTLDGGAYVAGRFHRVDGSSRPSLIRLAADGSLDVTYPKFGSGLGYESVSAGSTCRRTAGSSWPERFRCPAPTG